MQKQSDPFYHTAAWKKARTDALLRDLHLCVLCREAFERGATRRVRRATIVHHIIARSERPDLALELSNLQSICAPCHNQVHPEKGRRHRPGADRPNAPPPVNGVRIINI